MIKHIGWDELTHEITSKAIAIDLHDIPDTDEDIFRWLFTEVMGLTVEEMRGWHIQSVDRAPDSILIVSTSDRGHLAVDIFTDMEVK